MGTKLSYIYRLKICKGIRKRECLIGYGNFGVKYIVHIDQFLVEHIFLLSSYTSRQDIRMMRNYLILSQAFSFSMPIRFFYPPPQSFRYKSIDVRAVLHLERTYNYV